MIVNSKKLKRADGIVTVALFRCFKLFGKNYWYCRFGVEKNSMSALTFYAAEHTNKFTAYRKALYRAINRISPEL